MTGRGKERDRKSDSDDREEESERVKDCGAGWGGLGGVVRQKQTSRHRGRHTVRDREGGRKRPLMIKQWSASTYRGT